MNSTIACTYVDKNPIRDLHKTWYDINPTYCIFPYV